MHTILDDLQSDVPEVDKVSLERLANVNPSLLENIKETAQQNMQSSAGSRKDDKRAAMAPQKNDERPAFLDDLRSPEMIARSMAWKEHEKNVLAEAAAVTQALQEGAEESYKETYTQGEAMEMTQVIATASAVATFLAQAVERIHQDELAGRHQQAGSGQTTQVLGRPSGVQLDPALFTNEGVKQRNMAVVAFLYEVGLPFLSSADGRRFRTQLALSKHLDALFKRTQLEKSMTRAEERGWYLTDAAWQRKAEEAAPATDALTTTSTEVTTEDGYDPEKSTMPADENHDRCAICGLNFKMFFDNDNGIYMYKNCREIEVLNDEVALNDSENMMVHVTCWRALGSPEVLTMDQALQDTVRH
jgi:pre-mRNA cleavage complex 2 protein Pcf11